mgnify:CR=1 FL=1|nr:DUF3046 domain-containing protein [Actinomycetales bacterium]
MKHSELSQAFVDAFGEYQGPALQRDLALTEFGARSASEAAADGERPQQIWLAVCEAMDLAEDWQFPQRRDRPTRRV